MPSEKSALSRTVQLADRLERQIKQLNLIPGDSFMSTAEASKFLGVAGGTANRALRLLEKRGVIARRQKIGAVVADGIRASSSFACIHFLFQETYLHAEGFDYEEVLLGIQEEHPSASIKQVFLRTGQEEEQTLRLIERNLRRTEKEGFVLVRAPYSVQKMIEKSGLPAALFGTRPAGVDNIFSIDRDHVEAIQLVHRYLCSHDCRHAALILRNLTLAGDMQTIEYFHRIPDMETSFLFVPAHREAVEANIRKLLREQPTLDALVCHTRHFADVALNVALAESRSIRIVVLGVNNRKDIDSLKNIDALVVNEIDPLFIGRRIAFALERQCHDETLKQETIPVRLIVRRS